MELNKYIDHTNLKMNATSKDIEKLCKEALEYGFASVCINPFYVEYAKELLKDSNVCVCTVIGFPLGMNTISVKEYEAIDAINNGADEIDMVINVGALKDKNYEYIKKEIETIRDSIGGKTLKVIIETNLLEPKEIAKMTEICNDTYVNFVKTCTGFNGSVKLSDVEIISENKNEILEIKASGGIDDIDKIEELIKLDVTRIGTSHALKIMNVHHNCDCHCSDGCSCHNEEE